MRTTVGIIADTHGLLRSEAQEALASCDAILHAGDIGKPEVLDKLRRIAPVTAIRGNVDKWADELADAEIVKIEQRVIYLRHDINTLDLAPQAEGFDVVVSGHSHQPKMYQRDGVLFLNPGSAGPQRFRLPVTLALLTLSSKRLDARIVQLAV